MKLIAFVIALFSLQAMASSLDCRENHPVAGPQIYQIYFNEAGSPTEMRINFEAAQARGLYDSLSRMIYISAETSNDVYEISYSMDVELTPHRFMSVSLTSYFGGERTILCRYKK